MQNSFSTAGIKQVLAYPFQDPHWVSKMLIFFAICLASAFIPFVPAIFVCGYLYQIMHRIIREREEPALPEWTDWGRLLGDGFRLIAVSAIYSIPALALSGLSFIAYMVTFAFMPMLSEGSREPGGLLVGMLGGMGIFFLLMSLALVFTFLVLVFLPPAVCHTVAKGSFKAGFDISGWWKVLRANPGGFALALFVCLGMYSVVMLIGYVFYLSLVLCCLMYVVMIAGGIYLALVMAGLWGQVYREGADQLDQTSDD